MEQPPTHIQSFPSHGSYSPSHWDEDEPSRSDFSGRPSPPFGGQRNQPPLRLSTSASLQEWSTPRTSRGTNLSRKDSRRTEVMSYRALREAHAKGIQAKYIITTSPEGEILSGKLKWMAAVRAAAGLYHPQIQETHAPLEVGVGSHHRGA